MARPSEGGEKNGYSPSESCKLLALSLCAIVFLCYFFNLMPAERKWTFGVYDLLAFKGITFFLPNTKISVFVKVGRIVKRARVLYKNVEIGNAFHVFLAFVREDSIDLLPISGYQRILHTLLQYRRRN